MQHFLNNLVEPKRKRLKLRDSEGIFIAQGLDYEISSFFMRVIDKFISDWFLKVTQDASFIGSVKYELAYGLRKIAMRYRKVDYAAVVSTKLLPIIFTHFSEVENLIKEEDCNSDAVQKFLETNFSIHPAIFNRKNELKYLRSLAETLIPHLCTSNNLKCRPALDLVRELISSMLLLPLTDLISDPNTLNSLVIVATNARSEPLSSFGEDEKVEVELLHNLLKSIDDNEDDQDDSNDFFKDQEKLYNFMNYLKTKTFGGVDILRFVLDVDHLTSESEKSHKDPHKVSELASRFEVLLTYYRNYLYRGSHHEKPSDLQSAYLHAKAYLEHKWKHDYYKSADYYKAIYGDRDIFNTSKPEKEDVLISNDQISSQRLSTKIRNAMAMKVVTVDGIEEPDIQVWDALDVAVTNSPNYYKFLRRERGQDLDNFMQTFFHSIEQEADIGEDISAVMQARNNQRSNSKHKYALETYQNLFNIPAPNHMQESSSFVKTPTQSILYCLAKIIKIHPLLLRIVTGITQLLPDSDSLVLMAIRKFVNRSISQEAIARLIKYLQTQLFDTTKVRRYTQLENLERKNLAFERLEKIKSGLSHNLKLLQNPILNKHLIYSLLDIIITEAFPELKFDFN